MKTESIRILLSWFLWLVAITTPLLLRYHGFIDTSYHILLIPAYLFSTLVVLTLIPICLRYWHDYRALTRAFEEYVDATDPADALVAEEKWKKIDKLFGAEEPKE